MVANIAEGLTALFPERESEIDNNSQQLIVEVVALGKSIRENIAASSSHSHFISAHPYWGYFARELSLTQISIEEEGKEPSPARIAEIIELAKKHKIKALLVQPQYSDQSARTIAHEIDGRLLEVDPFAYDWLGSMKRSGTVFREALGG
jgi:zinc transport system substrate-binding protein